MFRVCFFVSYIIDKIIGTEEIGWTPTKGTCLTMSRSSYSFLCIEQYIAFTFVLKHLLYLRILLSFLGKENKGNFQHNTRNKTNESKYLGI